MKNLTEYIEEKLIVFHPQVDEKLVVNKNYKHNNADSILLDILDKHIDWKHIYNNHVNSTNTVLSSLEVNVRDNDVEGELRDQRKVNEISDFVGSMKGMDIYGFTYGRYGSDIYIDDMFEDIENNNIRFTTLIHIKDNGYIIEYYDGELVKILRFGRDKYARTYIAVKE